MSHITPRMLGGAVSVIVQNVITWLNENVSIGIAWLMQVISELAIVPYVVQMDALQCRYDRKVIATVKASPKTVLLEPIENGPVGEWKSANCLPGDNLRDAGAVVQPA